MMSKAKTVDEYIASLPEDRRTAINVVRKVILKNLDPAYSECMEYGGIWYAVPHSLFPAGYHCDPTKPLMYAGLSSQKNYMSIYLMCVYGDAEYAKWFQNAWKKTGKKLDMGKSCIRFNKVDDIALDVIGEAIKRVPAKKYIAHYQSLLDSRGTKRSAKPAKSKATTAKRRAKVKVK
ncbi:MAG: DUF1801 domain-containing protein [Anaerolineae bacterium]|nr:DUF1801 domain-containing protein [Phycisphaerae bacterium]